MKEKTRYIICGAAGFLALWVIIIMLNVFTQCNPSDTAKLLAMPFIFAAAIFSAWNFSHLTNDKEKLKTIHRLLLLTAGLWAFVYLIMIFGLIG